MKVLIIHHLETIWESGYKRFGTSFAELCEMVIDHIENSDYDRVILTRFEGTELEQGHHDWGLAGWVDWVEEYGYGWSRDMFDDYCEKEEKDHCDCTLCEEFTDGGAHSEIVWLPDWLRNLAGHVVSLCGAFDGECIEDMEIALDGCGVAYNRIEELII